jgi:Flp pilus assembly protein TadD
VRRRRAIGALVPWILAGSLLGASTLRADPVEEAPGGTSADSEYARGKKAVEAKDWTTAILLLSKAEVQDDRNADLENLLGYAYRNAGRFDEAFRHYRQSLRLNPRHRGAHEYIGEAYLLINDVDKAKEHLATLARICVVPCEEHEDLRRKIEEYKRSH